MIVRIPPNIETELITVLYIILAIIIWLWSRAVTKNSITEEYKLSQCDNEIQDLRLENRSLVAESKKMEAKIVQYQEWVIEIKQVAKRDI